MTSLFLPIINHSPLPQNVTTNKLEMPVYETSCMITPFSKPVLNVYFNCKNNYTKACTHNCSETATMFATFKFAMEKP